MGHVNIFKTKSKEELIKLLEDIYAGKISTTIIKEDKPTVNDLHPTMKPIKLLARFIKNSSRIDECILDLFRRKRFDINSMWAIK